MAKQIIRNSKIVGKRCPECGSYLHVCRDDRYVKCSSCKSHFAVNWRMDNEVVLYHRPGYNSRPVQETTIADFWPR